MFLRCNRSISSRNDVPCRSWRASSVCDRYGAAACWNLARMLRCHRNCTAIARVSGSANNVQLECVCTTLALALAVAAICCERRDSGIILQTAIDTAGDIHDVLSRRVSRRRHDTVSYGASASESTVGFLRSQRAVYRTAETEMCHGYRDITSAISRRSGRAF